jgi:hypothetical protein
MHTRESGTHEGATGGLSARDEQRAGSMADEGGASGAALEAQPAVAGRGRGLGPMVTVLAAAAGIVAGALWVRYRA